MSHSHPTADVSVRPSIASDAPILGEIQIASWRATGRLPAQVADSADVAAFTSAWASAISSPPSAKHRMLTATDAATVVGFAALAPADETSGEIVALEVHPEHVRQGHGSRLLAAATDILGATGATHVRVWVIAGDTDRAGFYTAAGFGPIGIRRTLDAGGVEVVEEAYLASLSQA